MAYKPGPLDADYVVRRYVAGDPAWQIAEALGCSTSPVFRILKRRGVQVRTPRYDMDDDAIVAEYVAGASEKHLADERGVARGVIRRILVARNVQIRGRSDAEILKWSKLKLDRTAVERQLGAAWVAASGRVDSAATKAKRSLSSFIADTKRVGSHEDEVAAILAGAGHMPIRQRPFGPYNIDVAVNPLRLAVEVVGSNLGRKALARLRERSKHILDAGWCLLFVYCGPLWGGRRCRFDRSFVAEYLIALANRARRNEPVHGRYGVVRGDGKATTMLRRYLHDLPVIPAA